jgi:hypothetical protein
MKVPRALSRARRSDLHAFFGLGEGVCIWPAPERQKPQSWLATSVPPPHPGPGTITSVLHRNRWCHRAHKQTGRPQGPGCVARYRRTNLTRVRASGFAFGAFSKRETRNSKLVFHASTLTATERMFFDNLLARIRKHARQRCHPERGRESEWRDLVLQRSAVGAELASEPKADTRSFDACCSR